MHHMKSACKSSFLSVAIGVAVAQLAASQLTETAAITGSGLWLLESWSNPAQLSLANGFELVIASKCPAINRLTHSVQQG